MTKEEYLKETNILIKSGLVKEEDLIKIFKNNEDLKSINKDNEEILRTTLNKLLEENILTKEDINNFKEIAEEEVKKFENEETRKRNNNLISYLNFFSTGLWLPYIAININNTFLALAMLFIPAYFLKTAFEYLEN